MPYVATSHSPNVNDLLLHECIESYHAEACAAVCQDVGHAVSETKENWFVRNVTYEVQNVCTGGPEMVVRQEANFVSLLILAVGVILLFVLINWVTDKTSARDPDWY